MNPFLQALENLRNCISIIIRLLKKTSNHPQKEAQVTPAVLTTFLSLKLQEKRKAATIASFLSWQKNYKEGKYVNKTEKFTKNSSCNFVAGKIRKFFVLQLRCRKNLRIFPSK